LSWFNVPIEWTMSEGLVKWGGETLLGDELLSVGVVGFDQVESFSPEAVLFEFVY
jgi:hypothetical protein